MAPSCDFPGCPHAGSGRLAQLAYRARRYRIGPRLYCSRDCLAGGLLDALRTEYEKVHQSRVDLRKSRLGSILISEGVLTREQLEMGLKFQQWSTDRLLGECLIEMGYITEEQLNHCISQQERLPYIATERLEVDTVAAAYIPHVIARMAKVVPCRYTYYNRELSVACLPPLNRNIGGTLARVLGLEVSSFLVPRGIFEDLLAQLEMMQRGLRLHREKDSFPLPGPASLLGLADFVASRLQLEDDAELSLGLIRDHLWVRNSVREDVDHYLFPLSMRST